MLTAGMETALPVILPPLSLHILVKVNLLSKLFTAGDLSPSFLLLIATTDKSRRPQKPNYEITSRRSDLIENENALKKG